MVKRDSTTTNSGGAKASVTDLAAIPAADLTIEATGGLVTLWASDPEKQPDESPAPPPVWARYIDSRFKQFCTR